ncbi:MAG TPA: PAS domain S-box protein [Usitatibacter sp.]|nr:PAS domain S-box protein [Usitatibacter sp.]
MAIPPPAADSTPDGASSWWSHAFFESNPNILFAKDLEGRYVHVNPAFERLVGPRSNVIGHTDDELFPPEVARQFREHDRMVRAAGHPLQFDETTALLGGPKSSITVKFPVHDTSGKMIATAGALMDFTERRRIQDELESYVARQRMMLATMPAIIWSTDAALTVTAIEGRGLGYIGLDGPKAVGISIPTLMRDNPAAITAHEVAFAGDTVRYEVTFRGREFTCTVGPMQDGSGLTRGVSGVALDVTEERSARRELAESQARYQEMYESCPLPMWAFDARTRQFLIVNQAAIALYGYSRQHFLSMRADDVTDPKVVAQMIAYVDSLERDRVYTIEREHRGANGLRLDVEIHYFLSQLQDLPVVVATVIDVTQRNRLARERERDQKHLQQVSQRLVTMQESERRRIADDLHERVGQSLSALGMQLKMMESTEAPPESVLLAEAQRILGEVGDAVRGIMSELRPEALHEYGLVAGLRDLEQRALRRFGVTLSIVAPKEDLRAPDVVESALYRLCQEALANTLKHAQARQTELTYRASARGIVLCIQDNGRGFDMARLRDPDKRSRWGLLMMRERAGSVGALFRISSSPGRGTRIVVSWRDRRAQPRAAAGAAG